MCRMLTFNKLRSKETSSDSAAIRQQVMAAREIQRNRFGEKKTTTNANDGAQAGEQILPIWIRRAGDGFLKNAMAGIRIVGQGT